MKESSMPRSGILLMFAACSILASVDGAASPESVDHATQAALELDAHPARGAEQFRQSCARCHGSGAQGDADQAIPALAGQRFCRAGA
jgi:cytochrome c553